MRTLFLDPLSRDLALDADGNIAVASDPYSLAQDAASAILLRFGELWFDTSIGVPYSSILGKTAPFSLGKSSMVKAALGVPGVTAAAVFVSGVADRKLSGQVQVTDETGKITAVNF